MTEHTRVAAYGLIINDDAMVLCRISRLMPQWAGWWTLPGGGLDFGEDPADAMVREVLEETGLIVEPAGIAGIDSVHLVDGGRAFHGIRIIYWATLVGGQLTHEENGSTDRCAWVLMREIEDLQLVDLAWKGIEIVLNGE